MKEMKIILIMAVVFFSNSCDKEILPDDTLTLSKTPFGSSVTQHYSDLLFL